MISQLLSRLIILAFGTLYPAYMSYKAVRTKNVREYVKWMMYWVVFAFFTTAESFSDSFLSWLPLYYELKIVFVLWLLAPATKGSSYLYRKYVHPMLMANEQEIDLYLERAKNNGVVALRTAGHRGLQAVATGVMQSNVVNMGQSYLQQQLQQVLTNNDAPAQGTTVTTHVESSAAQMSSSQALPNQPDGIATTAEVFVNQELYEEITIAPGAQLSVADTAQIKADARLSDSSPERTTLPQGQQQTPQQAQRHISESTGMSTRGNSRQLPRAPSSKSSTLPRSRRSATTSKKPRES